MSGRSCAFAGVPVMVRVGLRYLGLFVYFYIGGPLVV